MKVPIKLLRDSLIRNRKYYREEKALKRCILYHMKYTTPIGTVPGGGTTVGMLGTKLSRRYTSLNRRFKS